MAGSDVAEFLDLETVPNTELAEDLKRLVRFASENAPRSQQKALGPSEVGHPCARKLALSLMGEPAVNPSGDPLPSVVGTAAHAWLEDAVEQWNKHIGRRRFWSETRVEVRPGLEGTCDLYDEDTRTVIDWKFPGASAFSRYKRGGPSQLYRVQAHMYGRGNIRAGRPVDRVAIMFMPRGGLLSQAFMWSEPYDDTLVDETLERLDNVQIAVADLDVENHPERYELIPTTPTDCTYCPFWTPNPTAPTHCKGDG